MFHTKYKIICIFLMGFWSDIIMFFTLIVIILSIRIFFQIKSRKLKLLDENLLKIYIRIKTLDFRQKDIHVLCTTTWFFYRSLNLRLLLSDLKVFLNLEIISEYSFLRRHFPAWNVSKEAIYSKYILYPHRNFETCVKYIRTHFKHKYT